MHADGSILHTAGRRARCGQRHLVDLPQHPAAGRGAVQVRGPGLQLRRFAWCGLRINSVWVHIERRGAGVRQGRQGACPLARRCACTCS